MEDDALAREVFAVLVNPSPTGSTLVTPASTPTMASTGTTVSNTELVPLRILHERPPLEFLPD
jgi:hypothetical protein